VWVRASWKSWSRQVSGMGVRGVGLGEAGMGLVYWPWESKKSEQLEGWPRLCG